MPPTKVPPYHEVILTRTERLRLRVPTLDEARAWPVTDMGRDMARAGWKAEAVARIEVDPEDGIKDEVEYHDVHAACEACGLLILLDDEYHADEEGVYLCAVCAKQAENEEVA